MNVLMENTKIRIQKGFEYMRDVQKVTVLRLSQPEFFFFF